MDMEMFRRNGETQIKDMHQDGLLFDQSARLRRIRPSSLYLTKNKAGQSLLIVKFDNDMVWMPRWDEVNFLWCYAFLTELTNMLLKETDKRKPRTYNPQKHLIIPLLDFVNNEIGAWKLELTRSPIDEGIQLIKKSQE